MVRKSLHIILLLIVLVPALTGWAGDRCCPPDPSPCGASCGEVPHGSPRDAAHENSDPGHQQAVCGCSCHALSLNVATIPLSAPLCLGTLDPQDAGDPSSAHLSEIFRPPLA
jgi:hypothetical protein